MAKLTTIFDVIDDAVGAKFSYNEYQRYDSSILSRISNALNEFESAEYVRARAAEDDLDPCFLLGPESALSKAIRTQSLCSFGELPVEEKVYEWDIYRELDFLTLYFPRIAVLDCLAGYLRGSFSSGGGRCSGEYHMQFRATFQVRAALQLYAGLRHYVDSGDLVILPHSSWNGNYYGNPSSYVQLLVDVCRKYELSPMLDAQSQQEAFDHLFENVNISPGAPPSIEEAKAMLPWLQKLNQKDMHDLRHAPGFIDFRNIVREIVLGADDRRGKEVNKAYITERLREARARVDSEIKKSSIATKAMEGLRNICIGRGAASIVAPMINRGWADAHPLKSLTIPLLVETVKTAVQAPSMLKANRQQKLISHAYAKLIY